MTAVVAIMNKTGIALAADSAVTVTNGYQSSKIYNNANKLFMLSKFQPVGLMIFSSASFLQTPWEIIIKSYRKKLGNTVFEKLEDYKNDFLRYIMNEKMFSFANQESHFLEITTKNLVGLFIRKLNIYFGENPSEYQNFADFEGDALSVFLANITVKVVDDMREKYDSSEKLDSLLDYDLSSFSTENTNLSNIFKDTIVECINDNRVDNICIDDTLIMQLLYSYLTSESFSFSSTGVVFAGFGNNEIYPSVLSVEIDGIVNSKLRCVEREKDSITNENSGSIVPFAQKDVMQMFIEGIEPNLESTFIDTFNRFICEYTDVIANLVTNQTDKDNIRQIDVNNIIYSFAEEMHRAKSILQIGPTVNTVEILSKEDLAEMAESLIYLTFLKRRTSSSDESVGGPIDVAIISKGDGFIWKERKHYFEKEYNQHFFSNYFNN